jgi:hypothetical protein
MIKHYVKKLQKEDTVISDTKSPVTYCRLLHLSMLLNSIEIMHSVSGHTIPSHILPLLLCPLMAT